MPQIKLIQWNMLAQSCIKRENYPLASKKCLKKRYRDEVMVNLIKKVTPDVITCQEVGNYDFLKTNLIGFNSLYESYGRAKHGIAIFYNKKFNLVHSFREELLPFKCIWTRETSFIIGTVFEYNGIKFLVATTHLYWHPMADYARLRAVVGCLLALNKYKELPVIFAGDFNSTPDSAAINLCLTSKHQFMLTRVQINALESSFVSGSTEESDNASDQIGDYPFNKLWEFIDLKLKNNELLTLRNAYCNYEMQYPTVLAENRLGHSIYANDTSSAYYGINDELKFTTAADHNPLFTNYCFGFKACIDYILHHNIHCTDTLKLPNEVDIVNGIPNDTFPSDHLILGATFELK